MFWFQYLSGGAVTGIDLSNFLSYTRSYKLFISSYRLWFLRLSFSWFFFKLTTLLDAWPVIINKQKFRKFFSMENKYFTLNTVFIFLFINEGLIRTSIIYIYTFLPNDICLKVKEFYFRVSKKRKLYKSNKSWYLKENEFLKFTSYRIRKWIF